MASPALVLESVIGFGGDVNGGLLVHHAGFLLYPLGSTIVIRQIGDAKSQEFLQGHTDRVSCLALSHNGRYLASGQVTYMGFTADIIIWDLQSRTLLHRMSLHKVKVQSLSFSGDDLYLASLGGQDDSALVVWHVESGQAVCGSPTYSDNMFCVKFLNNSHAQLVAGGDDRLQVWDFDPYNRKIHKHDCNLGKIRRNVRSLTIDARDEVIYAGTSSGDLLQVLLKNKLFKAAGPQAKIAEGVIATAQAPSGDFILGGGDGTVAVLRPDTMKTRASIKLAGGVTSVVMTQDSYKGGGYGFYCGTKLCSVYYVKYDAVTNKLEPELTQSCHFTKITDVAFPKDYSAVFATASLTEIRVWHAAESRELLRITVPNLECNCVAFMADGHSIISGWSDGKIRAFAPQSGKLLYTIHDAHPLGVTALAGSGDCARVISGGKEGMVRVWRIGRESQSMLASMKDHKGPVNSIVMRSNDAECVSASSDGSCIIWDLNRYLRLNSLFASTFFMAVLYHPDESQLVTTGTDRKITYWDAYDGTAIRIIDGSDSAEINALAVSPNGEVLVSGGGDKLVKLWGYDEGICYQAGVGHSSAITNVKISPDSSKIVSVGSEGAVFIWRAAVRS